MIETQLRSLLTDKKNYSTRITMALLNFVFIHSRVLSIHERLVKYMAGHILEKRNGMSEKIRFVELMDAYGPQVMEIGRC